VDSAVHVRILTFQEMAHPSDDPLRLLRARRVVEIDQRMPVDGLLQEGKLLPEPGNIQ
jgi:hypothetical protein